jgi:hypothetical protein
VPGEIIDGGWGFGGGGARVMDGAGHRILNKVDQQTMQGGPHHPCQPEAGV